MTTDEKIGLHNLVPAPGSHRNRKRIGRGRGTGQAQVEPRQEGDGKAGARRPGPAGRVVRPADPGAAVAPSLRLASGQCSSFHTRHEPGWRPLACRA